MPRLNPQSPERKARDAARHAAKASHRATIEKEKRLEKVVAEYKVVRLKREEGADEVNYRFDLVRGPETIRRCLYMIERCSLLFPRCGKWELTSFKGSFIRTTLRPLVIAAIEEKFGLLPEEYYQCESRKKRAKEMVAA